MSVMVMTTVETAVMRRSALHPPVGHTSFAVTAQRVCRSPGPATATLTVLTALMSGRGDAGAGLDGRLCPPPGDCSAVLESFVVAPGSV